MLGATLPFALPIGLSAFLLFSVEPLVGRLVLPVFGGTPAVWATVLFFFQGVLLVGYLYGHVSVTRLGDAGAAAPPGARRTRDRRAAHRAGPRGRPADRDRPAGPRPHPDPVRADRPAGARDHDDDAARQRLVRGRARHASRSATATGCTRSATAGRCSRCSPTRSSSSRDSGLGTQRGVWAVGYALLVVLLAVAASRALPALRGGATRDRAARLRRRRGCRSRQPVATHGRSTGGGADAGCCSRPSPRACCRR